jgi:ParB-like chromosome segregation protein Spo0J
MSIDLTENEIRELIHVLEERLRGLRNEINHTTYNDFKAVLKDHERVLQCLHDKLVTCHCMQAA